MKTKLLIKIGLCLLFCTKLIAQSTNKSSKGPQALRIGIGFNHGYLKDKNFSAFHYSEGGLQYRLEYLRKGKTQQNSFYTKASFSNGVLKTSLNEFFNADYLQGNLSIGYLTKVWKRMEMNSDYLETEKATLSIGGGYQFYINYLNWGDQDAFSFYVNHGFEFSTLLNYKLKNRHHFSVALSIPVISLIVRPPYNAFDVELLDNNENSILKLLTDGYIGSFNKLVAYDLSIHYQYQLSALLALEVIYQNSYQNLADVNKWVQIQNQIALGFNLKF